MLYGDHGVVTAGFALLLAAMLTFGPRWGHVTLHVVQQEADEGNANEDAERVPDHRNHHDARCCGDNATVITALPGITFDPLVYTSGHQCEQNQNEHVVSFRERTITFPIIALYHNKSNTEIKDTPVREDEGISCSRTGDSFNTTQPDVPARTTILQQLGG